MLDVNALGYAGAILITGMSLPQLKQVILGKTQGVSLATWILFLINCSAWTAYGLRQESSAIIFGNILALCTCAPVVFLLFIRQKYWLPVFSFIATGFITASVIFAGYKLPIYVSAIAILILGLTLGLPQLIKLKRARPEQDFGVSVLALEMYLTGQILWLAYGVISKDTAVIAVNCVSIIITGTSVFLCWKRKLAAKRLKTNTLSTSA